MRPQPGDVIGGKYRIVRLIGDGGMGAVYEAHHELLGTNMALKFLHSDLARRSGLATRFLQEARVSARIQSPHVTRVTDVDQASDGTPFIVMELLGGESLQALLDRRRKLPRDQGIDFALQILSGLEAAHALGVVHRDLKPDNVFITPSTGGPVLKLLDFGIAKLREINDYQKGLTRPGAIMGTPEYMAPEQLYAADKVDHRADLYSLGVLLYEMLTGERPAYGDDAASIIGQVAQGKIKRLTDHDESLGDAVADVVHRAMGPEKDQRYESAMAMRLALANCAGELSHAGRLAATPAPAAVIPSPSDPPPKQEHTAELPPLETKPEAGVQRQPGGRVAPTLPPDDEEPAPTAGTPPTAMGTAMGDDGSIKGSTQEASKELIAALARQTAEQQAVAGPSQPPAAHAPAPNAMTPHPPGAGSHYATGGFGPPQAKRSKGGGGGALIALLLGVLVTGGAIAAVIVIRSSKDTTTPTGTIDPIGTTAPDTTIAPQGPDNTPPPVPTGPVGTTEPGPTPGPGPTSTGGTPTKKDAGAGGKKDGGTTSPFPPFPPLPSGLPPLPSNLPPLPTIPGIPGWPPPQGGQSGQGGQ